MGPDGAQILQARIEQQEHWRKAPAVRRGEQPAVDPDVAELDEMGEGIRRYDVREEHREIVDGRPALVIQRLTKRLIAERWETAYEIERVRPL
jgi:hypothetical protein